MIQVQEKWWTDSRRAILAHHLGSDSLADGLALQLWKLGFQYHEEGRHIPRAIFDAFPSSELFLKCDLVEEVRNEIRVKGSDYFSNRYKEAGSKGGKRRAKNALIVTSAACNNMVASNVNGATIDAKRFISAYIDAFQKRYGVNVRPDLSSKVLGQIKLFLKDTPIDRACNLIEVYLQLDTPWFKIKGHDFITFIGNINPISIALDTGNAGGNNWDKIFSDD